MKFTKILSRWAVRLGIVAAHETFPTRPVKRTVPYAAGGGPDVQARTLAEVMASELGQPVVVENKVGTGGILAGEFLAQQPADGYTLMLGASTHVTQKLLVKAVRFDPVRSFTHIIRTGLTQSPLCATSG